jgi:hypothetical protein
MESVIKEIQSILNERIRYDFADLKESLSLKLQYLDKEQAKSFLHQELFRATDILVQLRKSAVVESLFNYTDNPDFLWESALFENLTSDEKKKYRNFDLSEFDLKKYATQNNFYDDRLPYSSQIVQFIVYSRYINILNEELEFYQTKSSTEEKKTVASGEKPVIKKTFESNFDEQQIEILTVCINEARIFTNPINDEKTAQIFDCTLDAPLRVKNNRLLAYFFAALDDRSLIVHHWQSVCESNQMFLSSLKGNVLRQTDLSSATNECRDFPPKDSAIIDKYIKQLKKH